MLRVLYVDSCWSFKVPLGVVPDLNAASGPGLRTGIIRLEQLPMPALRRVSTLQCPIRVEILGAPFTLDSPGANLPFQSLGATPGCWGESTAWRMFVSTPA